MSPNMKFFLNLINFLIWLYLKAKIAKLTCTHNLKIFLLKTVQDIIIIYFTGSWFFVPLSNKNPPINLSQSPKKLKIFKYNILEI